MAKTLATLQTCFRTQNSGREPAKARTLAYECDNPCHIHFFSLKLANCEFSKYDMFILENSYLRLFGVSVVLLKW